MTAPGTSTVTEVVSLLASCDLPTDDLDADLIELFAIRDAEGEIVGCVGLERYDAEVLLRSLAVRADMRCQGIATSLVDFALERARQIGATSAYALTTSASRYLERRGFRTIERSEVLGSISRSTQFSTTCPDDALVLKASIGKAF